MFGQAPTMFDTIIAKIQTEGAKFLALKQPLIAATKSSDLNMQNRATPLYQMQLQLEGQLPDIMATVSSIQAGAYALTDVAKVGMFAAAMEKQIKDVTKAGIVSGAMSGGFDVMSIFKMGIGGVAILGAAGYFLYRAGRKKV